MPSLRAHRDLAGLGLALAALLALPAGAAAHEGAEPASEDEVPRAVEQALGDEVEPVGGGLYEVEVRGPNLTTHGPDPEPKLSAAAGGSRGAGGVGFYPGDSERPPVCATDYYQHVLYARTAATPDRYAEVVPDIRAAVRRMNAVLNQDALDSGGLTADYKVLCDSAGEIRVDSFVSSGTSFDSIVSAARAAGFNASVADYTIFFDGSTDYCGVGSYIEDETPLASNASNGGGGYAVAYRDCWLNETPMHENGHTQGAVQYGGPNSTGYGGHCNDEADVMCYSPDGGDLNQGGTVSRCTDRVHFDCGGDDYFDAAPEPGEYLATHWNIGSALNRFIVLGIGGPGVEPPTDPVDDTPIVGLLNGVRASALAAAPGSWRYFRIRVRRDRRALRVAIAGEATEDLDLYLRRGATPSLRRFDCRSILSGSREACRVVYPRAGRWYAGVYTAAGEEGSPFTIRSVQRR